MRIHRSTLLVLAVCVGLAGCGGSESSQPVAQGASSAGVTSVKATGSGQSPANADDDAEAEEKLPIAATASPAQVVTFFLDSLRAGNQAHVAATLTKKARQETSREGLEVRPIGTPDAKYEVGTVDYVGSRKDGAHVQSIWTEIDENGASATYDVIWVLRKQEGGWRIAGMATQMGEGEPPEFLNFENPKEMLRKLQQNAEETASTEDGKSAPGRATGVNR